MALIVLVLILIYFNLSLNLFQLFTNAALHIVFHFN